MRRLIGVVLVAAALAAVPVTAAGAGDGYETEKVIGADTRRRVDPTTGAIARRTVLITFEFGGQGFGCTGFVIDIDVVATAGHCVYDFGGTNQFATDIEVVPGKNGGSEPFGSCGAVDVAVPSKWQSGGKERWDFGAIELDCNVGESIGTMPLLIAPDPLGDKVRIGGYPGDKPFGTQWIGSGTVLATGKQQLYYDVDTAAGESGAPITNKKAYGCVCAVGIHTAAITGAPQNTGVRVNSKVVSWFTSFELR